ncbi:MAG TPA: Abi family protein [Solirubrobacterales bacterium]|nr:Abi family protein [Solirubrobacterales bacterium]
MDAQDYQHLDAVALYEWNAQVSAAFLEILCHVEVLLRNAVDRQFPATEPRAPLSILDADVWLCDPATLTPESREKVNEAITRLQRERKRPTRDRVIASLSFGFWQALFSGTYEELWRKRLWRAFPHGSGKRREIANLTGPILHFRNRVAHHEPIFFSNLERHHARILELARLIDEEAEGYIASLSRVDALLRERP